MKIYDCFDCGKIFDEDDMPKPHYKHVPEPLLCPNCQSENVDTLEDCECDNTHKANNTVCRWCFEMNKRGKRIA